MIYKVICCGSTDWERNDLIRAELRSLKQLHGDHLLIIEGGAAGADQIAKFEAHEMNIHVAEVKALWATRHKSAGPQRNDMMLALEPQEVIAFGGDRGTQDTVNKARKLGITVYQRGGHEVT